MLFTLTPRRRPPHDASVYVEVDQRAPNAVRHVVHCVKVMRMCSIIGWTRMRSVKASMTGPPSTSRESRYRPAARRKRRTVEGKQRHQLCPRVWMPLLTTTTTTTATAMVTVAVAVAVAAAAKTTAVTHTQQSTKSGSGRNVGYAGNSDRRRRQRRRQQRW